ncbi:hypothetical protein WDW89_18285 [Deltaproteobacteria bacterium TL4]
MMSQKTLNNPDLIQFKVMVLSSKGILGEEFNSRSAFWENMVSRQKEIKEACQFSYANGFRSHKKVTDAIEYGGVGKFLFQGRKKYSEQKEISAEKMNRVLGRALFQYTQPTSNIKKYCDALDRFPMLQAYKIKILLLLRTSPKGSFNLIQDLDTRGELLMQLGASFTTYFSPITVSLLYEAARVFAMKALQELESKIKTLEMKKESLKRASGSLSAEEQNNLEILEYNRKEMGLFLSENYKRILEQQMQDLKAFPELFIDYKKLETADGVAELCAQNQQNNITDLLKTLTQYRNYMQIGFVREAMNTVIKEITLSPALASNPSVQLSKLRNDYEQVLQNFKTTGKFNLRSLLETMQFLENCVIAPQAGKHQGVGMSPSTIQFHNMSVHRLLALSARFILIRSLDPNQKQTDAAQVQSMTQKAEAHYQEWTGLIQSLKFKRDAQQKLVEEHLKFKAHLTKVLKQING